jgi:hypothetical protein
MQGKKVLCIFWRKFELAITVIAKGLMAAPLGRGFYTPLEALVEAWPRSATLRLLSEAFCYISKSVALFCGLRTVAEVLCVGKSRRCSSVSHQS